MRFEQNLAGFSLYSMLLAAAFFPDSIYKVDSVYTTHLIKVYGLICGHMTQHLLAAMSI